MIVETLALVSPAYFSSPVATFSRFIPRRHPVDFRRKWTDGRRILGDGKTWEGLIIGTVGGGLLGIPFYLLFHISANPFLLAFLGLLGDLLGSFVKRRMGLERGEHAPLLDELDFLFPVFLYVQPSLPDALFLILVTPFLHRAACVVGYYMGVKREPW